MTIRGAGIPTHNIALFLDVDGTLIEIASTPDSVTVPPTLIDTLQQAAARAEGALAFITGRTIAVFDRLFAPHIFPAAGLHGFERRDYSGIIHRPPIRTAELDRARKLLGELQLRSSGLLLEDKVTGLAMHYRGAPDRELQVRETMSQLARESEGRFTVREGKCVVELAPAGYSKRLAIEAFMREEPFAGRSPVFIGDDVTDEDGFDAVNQLDGFSIRVGPIENSKARYHLDSVPGVLAWLEERNIAPR